MPTIESKWVEIEAELKSSTESVVKLYDGKTTGSVARHLVRDNEDGTFSMPEWVAKEKGFI
jgi:hypothetical protein